MLAQHLCDLRDLAHTPRGKRRRALVEEDVAGDPDVECRGLRRCAGRHRLAGRVRGRRLLEDHRLLPGLETLDAVEGLLLLLEHVPDSGAEGSPRGRADGLDAEQEPREGGEKTLLLVRRDEARLFAAIERREDGWRGFAHCGRVAGAVAA